MHLNNNNIKINKDWIVGFTDGEGCFYIGINKSEPHYFECG